MNKNLIIVLIALLLIGVGVGIYFSQISKEKEVEEIIELPEVDPCLEEKDARKKDICYWNLAQSLDNPNLCSKIESLPESYLLRDTCYKKFATTQLNADLCIKIESLSSKNECYRTIALSKKDYTLCEKLTLDYRDSCYEEIAKITKDPSICGRIEDPHDRSFCYHSLETEMPAELRRCEKIESIKDKKECYGVQIMTAAGWGWENLSITKCEQIREQLGRDICLALLVTTNWGVGIDLDVCDQKIKGYEEKNLCYFHVALAQGDASLCEKILVKTEKDQQDKNRCYLTAPKTGDKCGGIQDEEKKKSCIELIL